MQIKNKNKTDFKKVIKK
ncbi:MAG: hypothetical protein KA275_04270 [Chitinophagaceae bacterium]|nr:hypothetical protein [Chitinophagaceae bacterium]